MRGRRPELESLASSVVHVRVTPDSVIPEVTMFDSTGGVVSLFTVTVTGALVRWLPAASQAVAVTVWLPFAAAPVFHDRMRRGCDLGAEATPSTANCTGHASVVRGGRTDRGSRRSSFPSPAR
jgi:hypothetical protein